MGDIVDFMFWSGQLDWPDPFEHEEPNEYYNYKPPQCKYCGSTSVAWSTINGRWRLFTKGKVHTCNAYTSRRKST